MKWILVALAFSCNKLSAFPVDNVSVQLSDVKIRTNSEGTSETQLSEDVEYDDDYMDDYYYDDEEEISTSTQIINEGNSVNQEQSENSIYDSDKIEEATTTGTIENRNDANVQEFKKVETIKTKNYDIMNPSVGGLSLIGSLPKRCPNVDQKYDAKKKKCKTIKTAS